MWGHGIHKITKNTCGKYVTLKCWLLLDYKINQIPFQRFRNTNVFIKFYTCLGVSDCKWQEINGEDNVKVTRAEAQTWLALRHLLLDVRCPAHYDINEYRKNQLIKVRVLLESLQPVINCLLSNKTFAFPDKNSFVSFKNIFVLLFLLWKGTANSHQVLWSPFIQERSLW